MNNTFCLQVTEWQLKCFHGSSGENSHGFQLLNLFRNAKGISHVGFQFHTEIKSDSDLACHFSRAESLLPASRCERRKNGFKTFQQSRPLAHGSWLHSATEQRQASSWQALPNASNAASKWGAMKQLAGRRGCVEWSAVADDPSQARKHPIRDWTHFGFVPPSCQTPCWKCHTSAWIDHDVAVVTAAFHFASNLELNKQNREPIRFPLTGAAVTSLV